MGENGIRHLGVIMDGNRRWARTHALLSVLEGHRRGMNTFIDLCDYCEDAQIPYLTVYAFSTENWKREKTEVDGLFALMEQFFTEKIDLCLEKDMRLKIIGDLSRLSPSSREVAEKAMEQTAHCRTLTCQIAVSYGGRDEILRAASAYARQYAADPEAAGELTEERFGEFLDTAGVPDMDLVIRTGGDRRLSNFFPWQTVYADLYFTDVLWPDFDRAEFEKALAYYQTVRINKGR